MEWDTCAPEVILSESGCTVTDGDGNPFRYNQRDLFRRRGSVASNGKCHSLMLRVMAPCLPEPVAFELKTLKHPEEEPRLGTSTGTPAARTISSRRWFVGWRRRRAR